MIAYLRFLVIYERKAMKYKLIRSPKRRTIEMSIDDELEIVVRAPKSMGRHEIDARGWGHRQWAEKHTALKKERMEKGEGWDYRFPVFWHAYFFCCYCCPSFTCPFLMYKLLIISYAFSPFAWRKTAKRETYSNILRL